MSILDVWTILIWVTVSPLTTWSLQSFPNLYTLFFQGLDIAEEDDLPVDMEDLKRKISEVFLTRTRDEWATVFEARKLIHYAMRRWAVLFHP